MVTVLPALPFAKFFLITVLKMLLSVVFTEFFQKILKTLNWAQKEMAEVTNLSGQNGVLADAIKKCRYFHWCFCSKHGF